MSKVCGAFLTSCEMKVVPDISYSPASKESDIYDRCERVHKLQNEGFEDQTLFEALVCFRNL